MITFNRRFNGAFVPENLWGVTFNGEDGAHQFIITGVPTGTVTAYMMRADGTTCTVDGTNDGSTATVTLNADCYNVPGRFTLSIFVGDTGDRVCVYACVGTVYRTRTETIIDSGDVVPSLDDIIAEYSNMQTAEASAIAAASTATTASYVFSDAEIATFKADGSESVLNTINISAGGISPTAGTNKQSSDSDYAATCKIGYTDYEGPLLMTVNNSDFQWNVWIYTNKGTSYKIRSVTNKDYTTGPVVLPEITSGSHRCFRIGFKRIDGEAVTAEMMTALEGQITFYKLTDTALTTTGAAADAKATGDRLTSLESFKTAQIGYNQRDRMKLIQWKKNETPNATGSVSSMTVIGGKLYVFKYTANNEDVSDNKAYTINADGTVDFTSGTTFTSNLGHANTVNWNPFNGCLLTTRTPAGTDTNDGKRTVIIIPGVTNATTAFDRTATGAVNIDLDLTITVNDQKAFGDYRLNAVWGPNTVLDVNNAASRADLIYVVSDDSSTNESGKRRLALLQLATGSNTSGFSYGTAVTAEAGAFNGKYNVLQVWTHEWTKINNLAQGNNDATYYDGKIYEIPAPVSVAGFPLMVHSFDDFGLTWKTERLLYPTRSIGGSATGWEKGGCAIYNGHLYTSAKSAGIFVFEF